MHIRADFNNDALYIRLCGELDEHNAGGVRAAADRIADEYAARTQKAVFDLKNVSFMDSTAIGFLIGRYKKFTRYGVPVYVINPSRQADKILQMSGVYTLMPRL